tara:strand:- start:3966 stop:4727 length:762 start_codon:yes stop_codon:yes gene_type:complete
MNDSGFLYKCSVMHKRHFPVKYLFKYNIFSIYLDIDRLSELNKASRFFSVNKFNIFSFYSKDHLPEGEVDLRRWANKILGESGYETKDTKIFLLCMPRFLGWGFDPLSIWYFESKDGEILAAICEVHNTFGERYCYLIKAKNGKWPIRDKHPKAFHVSPFMEIRGDYSFSLTKPEERLKIIINVVDDGKRLLDASQLGKRYSLSSFQLIKLFFSIPFQTFKVVGAIHWHALKLWFRKVPFFHKPEPPLKEISR